MPKFQELRQNSTEAKQYKGQKHKDKKSEYVTPCLSQCNALRVPLSFI